MRWMNRLPVKYNVSFSLSHVFKCIENKQHIQMNKPHHNLSFTLWAPLLMTQALWLLNGGQLLEYVWGAERWEGCAQDSTYLCCRVIFFLFFRLLTAHRDQCLRGKRLFTTGYVDGSDRLHVLKERRGYGGWHVTQYMWINHKIHPVKTRGEKTQEKLYPGE